MSKLTLKLISENFSIHSLPVNSQIPQEIFSAPIYFIAKTFEEISIVLPSRYTLDSEDVETDWQALEVVGPLDFLLTGILSNISSVLADEKISIFAMSTFDTDYILVKSNTVEAAISALRLNHYQVITEQ
ncbi:MAG: ACT domain-containing protein [Colwellia sp.]|nr:ACT domain-containing protein [Colwellia sp.]